MICGEACGDSSFLAGGEIRPSKDTSVLLPSWLWGGKNEAKKQTGQISLTRLPLMRFFGGDLMNNYSSNNLDIYTRALLWRQKRVSSFCMLVGK